VLVDVARDITMRGKEGARQYHLMWTTAFPGSSIEVTNLFCTEDQAAAEFIGRGVQAGPLRGPRGDIAPTGRKIELRFCELHRVSNGKIISTHTYYNELDLMRQLGLIPQ
jgi:predicted ester cyclase